MAKYDNTRLRITPWPGVALPYPESAGGVPYVYDAAADAFIALDIRRSLPPAPSTTETYLKLAALDPDDVPALTRFACDRGPLDFRSNLYSDDEPIWELPLRRDQMPEIREAWLRAETAVGDRGYHYATRTEIRWGILYMRDLIAARRVLDGEIDGTKHLWESPFWARTHKLNSQPWTADGPATVLATALAAGLKPYTPHLQTFHDEQKEPRALWVNRLDVWNVCCLELFNHIVEGARYRTCANETCGRLFVRQEGRALHAQHRTRGVMYCSSSCARMQAQRAYRRRQRGDS